MVLCWGSKLGSLKLGNTWRQKAVNLISTKCSKVYYFTANNCLQITTMYLHSGKCKVVNKNLLFSDSCWIIVRFLSNFMKIYPDSCEILLIFLSVSCQILVRFSSDSFQILTRSLSDPGQILVRSFVRFTSKYFKTLLFQMSIGP